MSHKLQLQLRPLERSSSDTQRIYESTKEACERLNSYYLDFFETIEILKEKRNKARVKNDAATIRETTESIQFVEGKIEEVSQTMRTIAEENSFIVTLVGEGARTDRQTGS
jgi:hypothetical protein